ncbi:MAG: MoxR family ATPase [Clostridiales bacterium]|nr:MoxR family ATPase [Clostridiales bacterium]
MKKISGIAEKLKENIEKVIVGKSDEIELVILSLLCGGHILLEDVPGTGKTTLARAIAKSIELDYKRIQFTPDLLPMDLTGVNYYNQKQQEFIFRNGPVFTNILLADEINRATPRTQSSLLESMQEGQVSIDGVTHCLDKPFIVIATQNPIETQGTFPLPEAQLDRFFIMLSLGYPHTNDEKDLLSRVEGAHPIDSISSVISKAELLDAQAQVKTVKVSDAIRQYIVDIVSATREHSGIRLGASPRGSIALMQAAQGFAAINGREFVLPDDVKKMSRHILAHRIICSGFSSSREKKTSVDIIADILDTVPAPI